MYEKRLHTHQPPCCLDSILFPIRATSLRSLSAIEIDTITWSHLPLRKESYIHPQIILYLILGITTFFLNPRAAPLQEKVIQPSETYCINGQGPQIYQQYDTYQEFGQSRKDQLA